MKILILIIFFTLFVIKKIKNKYEYFNKCISRDNHILPKIKFTKLKKNNIYFNQIFFNTFNISEIKTIIYKIPIRKSNFKYNLINFYKYSIWDNNKNEKYSKYRNITIKTVTYISKLIIQSINKYIRKYKYLYKNNFCKMVNYSIKKIYKSKQNYVRLNFILEIYCSYSIHSYIFKCVIEIINNNRYINQIKFIGIQSQDKIFLLPGNNLDNKIHIFHNKNYKYNPNTYLRNSNENNIIYSNKIINNLLKKKKNIDNSYNYKCHGKKAKFKLECEADLSLKGEKNEIGVWDKKCSKNNECPFYKKNKNYPNNYGG